MILRAAAKYVATSWRTSSASWLSLKAVNPVRSPNSTETRRRSTEGRSNTFDVGGGLSGSGAGAQPAISGGAPRPAIGGIAAPHSRQNLWPGWLVSVPHAGQWSACGAPHWPQNFAPGGTSAEQLWHVELIRDARPGSGRRRSRSGPGRAARWGVLAAASRAGGGPPGPGGAGHDPPCPCNVGSAASYCWTTADEQTDCGLPPVASHTSAVSTSASPAIAWVETLLGSVRAPASCVHDLWAISCGSTVELSMMKRLATSMNGVSSGGSNLCNSADSGGVSGCRRASPGGFGTLLHTSTGTNEM